jgi:muramoyltetrapeptide carboxypeptidase
MFTFGPVMKPLVKPPRLRPGARIGVAAISGPVDSGRLAAGVRTLESRGYRVTVASNAAAPHALGFLAGSDSDRADGYRRLLTDPSIDAIFFARGGWGASRILRRLDPAEAAGHPKIHLGSSDLTALFAWWARHAGLATFYGPMVAVDMDGGGLTLDWEEVLSGALPAPHTFASEDVLSPGDVEGPLVGGCLSLLASLAGTPEALSARGAVLFWEDVGEAVYRVDRMLTQLERSGTFDDLRGMVIGSVVPGRAESAETVREYLRDRFATASFPVALGLPAGHLPAPRTLPLGARVRLAVRRGAGGSLEFLEAGVA